MSFYIGARTFLLCCALVMTGSALFAWSETVKTTLTTINKEILSLYLHLQVFVEVVGIPVLHVESRHRFHRHLRTDVEDALLLLNLSAAAALIGPDSKY